MKIRKISDRVHWLGAVDWDRRLFDALIPLPDGTSYNAYLVQGRDKTALLDAVDPTMAGVLLSQLEQVPRIDYLVAHHGEQDHSGAIPAVLDRYPEAKVVATPRGKGILIDLLRVAEERFITVEDGQTLPLGDRTLRFIHTPWVHWPETMVSYLEEERMLFSCDFFGSHLATSDLYAADERRVYEAAKRYYAEIMMPFAKFIRKNMEKLSGIDIELIAPSHGPVYNRPALILDAYRDWASEVPRNMALVPFISMHGSTARMVDRLVGALTERGVAVRRFNLEAVDLGSLAEALVDAATIVIGTPTFLEGPHPNVLYAVSLVNALRPKLKFAAVVGSYGWNSKAVDRINELTPNLKVEHLGSVLCKGLPGADDYHALDALADRIAGKHREMGIT